MSKEKQIQYKIIEIKKLSHFENDFGELDLTENDLKTVGIEISQTINVDLEKNTLTLKITCNYHPKNNRDKKLFGISVMAKFVIKELKEHVRISNNDQVEVPLELVKIFLSTSLSAIRGMLAVLNTNPDYQKMILPDVNLDSIAKNE